MRALIVDDEALARRRVSAVLRELPRITAMTECATADEAVAALARREHDVVFLDVEMPDLNGVTLAESDARRAVALVFVTAHERYAARAFDLEAVDYVLKPFDDERLVEAVRRAERWLGFVQSGGPPAVDCFGDVAVHYATHRVTREGKPVELRPKEYELLVVLLRRGGAIATRAELLRDVWGYDDSVVSRTVDTHVAALRRQLERDPARPRHIVTVRQYGYRLERGGHERD